MNPPDRSDPNLIIWRHSDVSCMLYGLILLGLGILIGYYA